MALTSVCSTLHSISGTEKVQVFSDPPILPEGDHLCFEVHVQRTERENLDDFIFVRTYTTFNAWTTFSFPWVCPERDQWMPDFFNSTVSFVKSTGKNFRDYMMDLGWLTLDIPSVEDEERYHLIVSMPASSTEIVELSRGPLKPFVDETRVIAFLYWLNGHLGGLKG